MSKVLFLDNDDEVLDVIMDFPAEMRKKCLKFLSQHPDLGSSYYFMLPDRGYGMIMKFVSKDDDGLILIGADEPDEILNLLEGIKKEAPTEEHVSIQAEINTARYCFTMIKAEITKLGREDE